MFAWIDFRTAELSVRKVHDSDLTALVEIYRQCEDFLSLGPVDVAAQEMVLADISHSRAQGCQYCVTLDTDGRFVGVLDVIPELKKQVACLSLLMIGKSYRNQGFGTAVLSGIEHQLKQLYGTTTIEAGVQVNNHDGIRFWQSRGFLIGATPILREDGTTTCDMTKEI